MRPMAIVAIVEAAIIVVLVVTIALDRRRQRAREDGLLARIQAPPNELMERMLAHDDAVKAAMGKDPPRTKSPPRERSMAEVEQSVARVDKELASRGFVSPP